MSGGRAQGCVGVATWCGNLPSWHADMLVWVLEAPSARKRACYKQMLCGLENLILTNVAVELPFVEPHFQLHALEEHYVRGGGG